MRWTKGKPASAAPCDTPILCVFDRQGEAPRYAVMKRTRGPWASYGSGQERPTFNWSYLPSGAMADEPDRFWTLPGRERG
jgi:hypothetical protein